jgi:hypothetical protein
MEYVLVAMKLATTRDSGVIQTTTSAIPKWILTIKNRVPRMVITPVNNCVKPIRRPSAKVSTSATTRLRVSP